MYKCDTCGKTTQPHEGCNVTPVEFRPKTYSNLDGMEIPVDRAPLGYEIVRQEKKCYSCYQKWVSGERPAPPPTRKREVFPVEQERRRGSRGESESFEGKRDRHENKRRFEKERD